MVRSAPQTSRTTPPAGGRGRVQRRMTTFRQYVATMLTAAALTGGLLVTSAVPADAAVVKRLRTAVADLPVATETRSGYERSKFRHWNDSNSDCQDTRAEVLAAESKITVRGCSIVKGSWVSYYDRKTWTKASDVDIDHLVPLAESWDSGAKKWNADTRARYANDLGDARTLVAVTDNVNQSKGDRDPADWLPRYGKCTYVAQWVAVKIRWSLRVDRTEKSALTKLAADCDNQKITVTKAKIVIAGSSSGGGGGSGSGSGNTTDPRYPYCKDLPAGYGPYYQGVDPEYAWYRDADSDGVVCE